MKVLTYFQYGSPEMLQLQEVEKPVPKDDEVLVKVHAVSLNASDMEMLTANPSYVRMWGFFKPKFNILGSDISGVVEAIGENVSQFKVGDEVFGDNFERWGGLAEYVSIPVNKLLQKPKDLTFEEAAALPQAGVVALQGLRDKGQIQSGQKVLINGAGGGAGTFAIQLAKHFGAEVTGVDNELKLELMRSLGADYVVDYQKEDFTKKGKQYDLIFDLVAHRSIFDHKRALNSNGKYVVAGGAIPQLLQTLFVGGLISIMSKKNMGILVHQQNKKDINYMVELLQNKKIVPIIDKTFPLENAADAFQYLLEGSAKGKVVIKIW